MEGLQVDNRSFNFLNEYYLKYFEVHLELKRLQKEIDEANDEQDFIMQSTWGSKKPLTSELSTRHEHLNDLKYDNQSKIKQIIEEL